MHKFKVDENLPTEVVELLSLAGHDAVSVLDQQLGGSTDPLLAGICQQEGRALITLDLDFADIRTYPPSNYSGMIVLRLARLQKSIVVAVMQRLVVVFEKEPITGKLWVVDETTVRVHD